MAFQINWINNLVEIDFIGSLTFNEIREIGNSIYGDSRLDNMSSLIVNFSQSDGPTISKYQTSVLASLDSITETHKPKMKMAFVTQSDDWHERISEYIEYKNKFGSTWIYSIFSSLNDAREWCQN